MILVIYNEDNEIVQVMPDIKSPVVNGASIEWQGGSLIDIKLPFLLLDDAIDVGDNVTDEFIALDKKDEFIKFDLLEQIQLENKMNAISIMELAQMMLGGK